MAGSEADATTARDEETLLLSPAGFTPHTPAELAARVPNLEVMNLLGHGGMGIVYKGRQPFLGRPVAIKVIRPDLQTDDAFQQRFLREARTLAKLRHPFIVTVFDVCKAGDLYGLVMEYVEGASLRQLLAGGSITQRDALDFVPQIAVARSQISADVRANGREIRELLRRAQDEGAAIVHFPDGAMFGCSKAQIKAWDRGDRDALVEELRSTADLARNLEPWAVVGCSHRLPPRALEAPADLARPAGKPGASPAEILDHPRHVGADDAVPVMVPAQVPGVALVDLHDLAE
jgi:hypothetical protein